MKTTNTLKLSTYTCQLVLVVTDQLDTEVNALYKKNKLSEVFDLDAEGVMVSFNMSKYYLIIDVDCLSHNTIAHECFHVVNRIMQDRDIRDEEAGAWIAGHVSSFIYKSINKKNLTIKNG